MKANKKVMAALLAAMMSVSAGAAVVSAADVIEKPVSGPSASATTSTGTWYSHQFIVNGELVTKYAFKDAGSDSFVSGWRLINNKWYYFDASGYALCNTTQEIESASGIKNTYRFGADCAMITGWYQLSNAKDPIYGDSRNWEYYSPSTGAQQDGWIKVGANWFFMTQDITSIQYKENNYWVTKVLPKGTLLMDGTYKFLDGENKGMTYTFAANGVLVNEGQGWVQEGGNWYWVQEDGTRFHGGLVYEDATTRLFTKDSWNLINGKYYIFDDETYGGKMLTGWVLAQNAKGENKWYYCTTNGDCVLNSWIQNSTTGDWYLTNASGEMVTGWAVRGGKTYYLDTDAANYGVMVTGTVTINSSKCTFDANGTLVSINDQKVDPGVIPTL